MDVGSVILTTLMMRTSLDSCTHVVDISGNTFWDWAFHPTFGPTHSTPWLICTSHLVNVSNAEQQRLNEIQVSENKTKFHNNIQEETMWTDSVTMSEDTGPNSGFGRGGMTPNIEFMVPVGYGQTLVRE